MRSEARPAGLTLIELLAVIAIASLVTSVGIVTIGNARRATAVASLIGELRSLDARARLHARTSGSNVVLQIDAQARTIHLIGSDSDREASLAYRIIPLMIALKIESLDGRGVVCFDRLGVSDDYALVVDDGVRSRRMEIAGLTGNVHIQEIEP